MRCIHEGPDGALWVVTATPDGRLIRIAQGSATNSSLLSLFLYWTVRSGFMLRTCIRFHDSFVGLLNRNAIMDYAHDCLAGMRIARDAMKIKTR